MGKPENKLFFGLFSDRLFNFRIVSHLVYIDIIKLMRLNNFFPLKITKQT